MLNDRLRVFVSSKMAELAAERAAIKEILDELEVDAWIFEQDAGARPETIEESYKEQLEASDLYIGVFWKGYGAYTIDEFELAQAIGMDCLVYQKQGGSAPGRDPQLQEFLNKIGKVETGITAQFFDTPDELRQMVKRDTARWQTRIVRKYRDGGSRRAIAGLPADPNLAVLRNKVKQVWVEGVLGRAVAGTGLVELAMERRPGAVAQPLDAGLESPEKGGDLDPETSVAELFARLQSSLLVLGDPGSGKTTTALQLTRDLIARAERDESLPVPVVLNLSAWSPEWRTLNGWIARELSKKYQVPAQISRVWIEQDRLVLVLDGLDEVAPEHRGDCAGAINRFCDQYAAAAVVVTSQSAAYEALPVRLNLNGAIRLQPLGSAQVDAYLEQAGDDLAAFRKAVESDETLQELARSPLMLGVMSLAYRGRSTAELEADASDSAETRRARLFGAYVDRAFADRKSSWSYSREATSSWLSWLARRMSERSRTVFLIEDLQPDWLATRAQLNAYLLAFAGLFGLVFGALCILYRNTPSALPDIVGDLQPPGPLECVAWVAACALFLLGIDIAEDRGFASPRTTARDPRRGLWRIVGNLAIYAVAFAVIWLPIALSMTRHLWTEASHFMVRGIVPAAAVTMGAAAFGARRSLSRSIQTTESLGLERTAAARGALWGLVAGVPFWLISSYNSPARWLGLFWCVIGAALGIVLTGFQPRLVRGKTIPNQGMILTLRAMLRAAAMALPVAALFPLAAWAAGGKYRDPGLIGQWSLVALLFLAVCFAAWFGGLDLAKHAIVRAIIGATRQGPWDFRGLLAETDRRNLTQRVGGGFMFVHRPLLEHFAALELPPPLAEEVRDTERERRGFAGRAIAWMTGLALLGAVTLFAGLATEIGWVVAAGGILLGIGTQWLVIRSAVTSAVAAGRREEDDG